MSALVAPTPPATHTSDTGEPLPVPVADIDRSCRGPVLLLITSAVAWLMFGTMLSVVSAIKAHVPGLIAGTAWLSYGRIRPAGNNALLYGFAFQAGLAIALWLICRLGRNTLQRPWILNFAAATWNLGVTIGLLGILAGESTGYEWLEMPPSAALILFFSYALTAVWALITFHFRRQESLYVSQWFLLLALLWFPWTFSSAELFLVFSPVRGALQAVVSNWAVHNLFELCLAPLGLATIFYFIPKLLDRPLSNRYLVLVGFWTLALFGSWGGYYAPAVVPNWISSLNAVMTVLMIVPLMALAASWHLTFAGNYVAARSPELRFFVAGAASYLLAIGLQMLGAVHGVARVTLFTLYTQGIPQIELHGFMALALAGAIYHVVPLVARVEWPSLKLIRIHFWCAVAGLFVIIVTSVVGGLVQGFTLIDPRIDFLRVMRLTEPFLGITTLGLLLLLIGYGSMIWNLAKLLKVFCPICAAKRKLNG